jgi:hypothetical protein
MAKTIICDSVTTLGEDARDAIVLSGSHGGTYAAFLAAEAGVRAIILNDAGVGRDKAGIAGLTLLESLSTPAATVSYLSARIGYGEDAHRRGVVSHANSCAIALGVEPGTWVRNALRLLQAHGAAVCAKPERRYESRLELGHDEPDLAAVVLVDSASQAQAQDAGRVIVTGSHGGLLGGRPETALKVHALAAVFNDAGVGIDNAGISRLSALEARGIAALTVDAWTARIGEARSTLEDGIISHLNRAAQGLGGEIGMTARDFVRNAQRAAATELRRGRA